MTPNTAPEPTSTAPCVWMIVEIKAFILRSFRRFRGRGSDGSAS